MSQRVYRRAEPSLAHAHPTGIAPTLYGFMRANICSSDLVIEHRDQEQPFEQRTSQPGCVIASPSFADVTNQDYVHHWVRDAAITAMELAAAPQPDRDGVDQALCDYVNFSTLCREKADRDPQVDFFRACFTIDGAPRPWSDQKDGPALQSLAFFQAEPYLDAIARENARRLAQRNLNEIAARWSEDDDKFGPWEDVKGKSFFARSVQLRLLEEVAAANPLDLTVPDNFEAARGGLRDALKTHWNETEALYTSVLDLVVGDANQTDVSEYDPNSDILMSCIYGSIPCTDPKLLSTASQIRRAYIASGSAAYPINESDRARGLGPLVGRYPSDRYDGDTADGVNDRRHPWAVCTLNLAQLYYALAAAFANGQGAAHDTITEDFFDDLNLAEATVAAGGAPVVDALRSTGDEMVAGVLYHSSHFHLSEQFDSDTGYEKSVQDLTWSYASYLSAIRARP